jgi:O-antigen ligase/polysaccharide polymerase Wzy-like membrane protein
VGSREAIPALGTFALVSALGLDEGGYAPTAWGWSAVVVFAFLAVLLWRDAARPTPAAVALVVGLAALTVWTAVSALWSDDVAASVLEVERVLLYVGAAAVFALSGSAPALLAGVLGATTLLCTVGLANWLLGDPEVPLSADPQAADRLSEPIGYANGVALLAAMGLLLGLGFAARAGRAWAATAAAPLPLLAATLSFTYGRGAWLALGFGLAVGVLVGPGRLQLAATAAVLALLAATAVAASHAMDAGVALAVVILILSAGSAGTAAALRSTRVEVPRAARTGFAAALIASAAAVVATAILALGGPSGAYDSFKQAPAPVHGDVGTRVFSASGSSRADYWSVAWHAYEDEPLMGQGAGTYARTWLAERPVPQPVLDAHSLYLETLAELGPIGLLLLALALAAPLAGRRSRWTPVALAPYAAFLLHASQDWDWELPAVTVAALACGAAMVVPPTGLRLPKLAVIAPLVLCVAALFAYAGNRVLAEALVAADSGDFSTSADRARTAHRLQPWSAEPWRLLGEAELAGGADAAARRSFRRGLEQNPYNWELWLGLGLASEGTEQRAAWTRAKSLNPLSPELQELGFQGR